MKYEKIGSSFIWEKRYLKRFIAGVVGYGLMFPVTIFLGKNTETVLAVQIIFALLPVIPFLLAMSAYIANFKTMDEMWKKIQTEALLMTAMITIAISFSLGMLQVVGVMKLFSVFFLFPFMMVIWLICFSYLMAKEKVL